MQFTMKLLALLPLLSFALASPVDMDMDMDIDQQTIQLTCNSEESSPIYGEQSTSPAYGFRGPGVYHIVNTRGGHALSINTKVHNPHVGVWQANNNPAQHWIIAAVGHQQYSIISNVTGAAVTVKGRGQQAIAYRGAVPSLASHFYIDFQTWADTPGYPVAFKSVANKGQVLDQSAAKPLANGTPVISYNTNTPRSGNQAWRLQYLH
ncbi:MAG: hypothetical protein M1829_005947 [Trizodia sp. TS-e1964]|nr:MAG: hypothetical protein M1829_005947 [Trizodia sp. TS-e1964]